MTNIAIPQQCEYWFQCDETTLLQGEPITILDILNTHGQWEDGSVRGKILNLKDQRSVGSPRKRQAVLDDVTADHSSRIPHRQSTAR